jgi:CHRD domain
MSTKLAALAAVTVLVAGCDADRPGPTEFEVSAPMFVAGGNADFNLGTHLRGEEEVFTPAVAGGPTPADSRAQGQAIFRISADGATVDFRLIASNIDNAIMAHIHCGRPGANGPISMWLFPVIGPAGAPLPGGAGPQDGVLASGTFSPVGIVCPATAVGEETPLLDAMRAGLTYVNVHTSDGVEPPNTGPGDFPGGEIRGQLDHPGGH